MMINYNTTLTTLVSAQGRLRMMENNN